MPIPAIPPGLALAGKLISYGSTGLLLDELTGKNVQRLLMGTPEKQRKYTVDSEGNYQPRKGVETKPKAQKEKNFFERFLFGIPEAQRSYTVNDDYEYQARKPVVNPGAGSPGQQFNPNQDLPASAEQSVDTTPMATANALYQQGREAAKTQAEMNQIRDVGLGIHKAHNPHLYSNFQIPMASDRTFNPLMARTFPETYAQTPEAFVASGGVQMPSSMSNADDRNAVIEGNRLEGEQRMMQAMAEAKKQEFMREMLAKQTGRK